MLEQAQQTDLTNLGYKLAYLPERQQYFVNIDCINHLKVGRDKLCDLATTLKR